MNEKELLTLLDTKARQYNQAEFVESDPISIPHSFSSLQDVEISAFFAATLAWGLRKTIIAKCRLLMQMMDNAPHQFMLHHTSADLKPFTSFKHRTFNATDVLYFIQFLSQHYRSNQSLQTAFSRHLPPDAEHAGPALEGFHNTFFSLPHAPQRTRKHVATPARKSACKRLNMFLRWMVRRDNAGVDLGLWTDIDPAQLLCPLDVHVERTARKLGLLQRKQTDWKAALELTANLRRLKPDDPVLYDYALFGMGVMEKGAF